MSFVFICFYLFLPVFSSSAPLVQYSLPTPIYVRSNFVLPPYFHHHISMESPSNVHRFGGHSVEMRWTFGGDSSKEDRRNNGDKSEKRRR